MKRAGYLTEKIADFDNLNLAFSKACRGKQRKREVLDFREHLEDNLAELRGEILTGQVNVGHYHYFTIYDPKERIICAAPLRERILHHALMNVCHPYFDRSLIPDTYATRPSKGVYQAIERAVEAVTECSYVLKLDVRKYYDSIDHDVLKEMIARKFKDSRLINIFSCIIDSYNVDIGRGLPIGNLTSQYFANLYLSGLDHYVKERLHARHYIRYMDDMLVAVDDKVQLVDFAKSIATYASEMLKLQLKPPIVNRTKNGVAFLGYRVLPYHVLMAGRSKRRFRTKLMDYEKKRISRTWSEVQYSEHITPLLAYVQHAVSRDFRKSCIDALHKYEGENREWV